MARVKKINCDGNLVMIFPDNSVMVFDHPQMTAEQMPYPLDDYGRPIAGEPIRMDFKVTTRQVTTFNGGYGGYKRIKERQRRNKLKGGRE